jgi:aminopeptidase C
MKAQDDYQWRIVKTILERHGVSPMDFVPYRNFFKEISSKKTRGMNKDAQKIRVDEIKAKYEKWRLRPEVLKEIAKLVSLKVSFPD